MNQPKLLSTGMKAVLVAQFISALADNALLFAAIAVLASLNAPSWQTPMLQEFFVIAFILLAPFVGPFADAWPKGNVMLIANAIKAIGATCMLMGVPPLISYGIVGIGAALYSPAKYGILGQLVTHEQLVKANSLMEGSTIVAILVGTVVGGWMADHSSTTALTILVLCYIFACGINIYIPKLEPIHPVDKWRFAGLFKEFYIALKTLILMRDSRVSLLGTSIFWGAGSTLRFLLVAWLPVALQITETSTAANLSGVVAIGIAIGAAFAAKYITLETVQKAMPAGFIIGILIAIFAINTSLITSILLLICIGICGGFYVVPLNALLQERGHTSVGAGHAIAVQNFFENLLMLVMVGGYVAMTKAGVDPIISATIFGIVVSTCIGLLWLMFIIKKKQTA